MASAQYDAAVPHGAATSSIQAHYDARSGTPSRYVDLGDDHAPQTAGPSPRHDQEAPQANANASSGNNNNNNNNTPSSTGLIRLSLRKPMGIVFEPMYDPNNSSIQRGVRICDLPRTGAAALSRKLEVGDELLSINDKTMSRLSFDEIMDFIIEADPEEVNLLFRRPRKETLSARHSTKAHNSNSSAGVKWVDDEHRNKRRSDKKKTIAPSSSDRKGERKTGSRRSRKEDDETFQSEDQEYPSRVKRKSRGRKDPFESESFLDILIDTICANPDNVCRDRRRHNDDDYYSDEEDDGTFASRDDSTYVTYESEEVTNRKGKQKSQGQNRDDDSSTFGEEVGRVEKDPKRKNSKRDKDVGVRSSPPEETKHSPPLEPVDVPSRKYEDDRTLETMESAEHLKVEPEPEPVVPVPPLGLVPNTLPAEPVVPSDTDDERNPAPIKEVQYDDQVDHGADVSVMESLGGPSLLIEQQRKAAIEASKETPHAVPFVPEEYIEKYGHNYPVDFGFSLQQTISNDPLRFYTFVVKTLLHEHEPEKVRLLDKLLAKYKGREDHLVQKLSVRYNKDEEPAQPAEEPEDPPQNEREPVQAFEDAVNRGKDSASANEAIKTAKQRLQTSEREFDGLEWPQKETKEPEPADQLSIQEGSDFGSDYSGDSIDGTSPAVIAQVSELLNYVYGKTSVPGQIDRVSVIMRAYEGREAVLLELLETKALIKANREKENEVNLPSFLRNSVVTQRNLDDDGHGAGDVPPVTPMATQPQPIGGAMLNDDISSMSGVSSPVAEGQQQQHAIPSNMLKPVTSYEDNSPSFDFHPEVEQVIDPIDEHHGDHFPRAEQQQQQSNSFENALRTDPTTPSSVRSRQLLSPDRLEKKKKKGIFGGLFGGKRGRKSKEMQVPSQEHSTSRSRGLRSPMSRKIKTVASTEGSI